MKKNKKYLILILFGISLFVFCINAANKEINISYKRNNVKINLDEGKSKYNLLSAIQCYCLKTTYVAAECGTCYPDTVTCVPGWVESNCDSCYYGSSNACVGGYNDGACNSFGEEAYNSGNGGSNTINETLTNTTSQNGVKEGNGKFMLTYLGE